MAAPQRSAPGVLQLQGAWHVARAIDEGGNTVDALNRSLLSIPTGHVHDRESLLESLRLLNDLGLIIRKADRLTLTGELTSMKTLSMQVFVETLLVIFFIKTRPLWLTNVRDDDPSWPLVPQDASALLRAVFEHPGRRDAFVINLARKVDALLLAEIGDRGEEAVAEALRATLIAMGRPDLAKEVVRESLHDDTLGYDISSPDPRGRRHLVEAKATKSLSSRIDFFISRNEVTVAAAEPMWSIVVAQDQPHGEDFVMRPVGWLAYEDIDPLLPHDAESEEGELHGRWQSVKITIHQERLRHGLPFGRD